MNDATLMSTFIAGFVAGGLVAWQVSKTVERFRRARYDFRIARSGIRTLVEMMFKRGWDALRWSAAGAVILAVVVYAWRSR